MFLVQYTVHIGKDGDWQAFEQCTIQRVVERKITTCLSPPEVDEFCNLVERSVELSTLFNKRRKLPSLN